MRKGNKNQGILGCVWFEKQQNKLVRQKAFIDTLRIKSADLKSNFLFKSFVAFRAILMYEKAAVCPMLPRMIGDIKGSRNWFRFVFILFLYCPL